MSLLLIELEGAFLSGLTFGCQTKHNQTERSPAVKIAKDSIGRKQSSLPTVKFENQQMTSFGGLVVFQAFFQTIGIYDKLRACCRHLQGGFYRHDLALRCLLVHIILGFRRLREMDHYRDDPLVLRALGLRRMPSVPTVSRMLGRFDGDVVEALRRQCSRLVLERLAAECLTTVTLDFDGTVLSTTRHAEGTAVGFNKQKKGARSYYPLLCTVAQAGQVLDVLHRPGNVHDSAGSIDFVRGCVALVRSVLPFARIETRMDSAFFSDTMISALESLGVEYSVSVPFERFVSLKGMIEARKHWLTVPGGEGRSEFFEARWKPNSWKRRGRFLFIRTRVRRQSKEPVQLDLFRPVEEGHDHKVIITNKRVAAGKVCRFHEGRGYQEKIYAELKDQAQGDYVGCRKLHANQSWLLCAILAHNLTRELQMRAAPPSRGLTAGRTVRWVFQGIETIRRTVIQRAGRLTRPQGNLTITLPNIIAFRESFIRLFSAA
jgi:hypothetical protein